MTPGAPDVPSRSLPVDVTSNPSPVVTVRGEAQAEVAPDLATFSFTVHAAGDSPERTRSELADASGRVARLVGEFGAAVERSSSSGLHLAPVFNRKSATKITGYRGTWSTQVVLNDFTALSDLVLRLATVVDSQVDGPWWSLRPDNPMHRQVRLDAIADARVRADDYAAAFGSRVVDLVEVSDLESYGGGRPMFAMRAGSMAADESPFEFEPEQQTVSGQVTVRFTIVRPDLSWAAPLDEDLDPDSGDLPDDPDDHVPAYTT